MTLRSRVKIIFLKPKLISRILNVSKRVTTALGKSFKVIIPDKLYLTCKLLMIMILYLYINIRVSF